VLWALERARDRRLRMRELADMTVISRSNLTRLVDRLEPAGLVERERAEEDRRGAFAVVTAEGRAMRRKMWPVYSAAIKELFEDQVAEREAAQMGDALRRILDAVHDRTGSD
jgi:DNA-binding MarR family transcriptional regulator